jgi:hypothetical protein
MPPAVRVVRISEGSEIHNLTSALRSMGFDIAFGIASESRLPLILSAPSDIPERSPYVCLFGNPSEKDLSLVFRTYASIKNRLFSFRESPAGPDEFASHHFLSCETVGHATRWKAYFEADRVKREQIFEEAFRIYEGVIYATCHSSLIDFVESVRKKKNCAEGRKKSSILFQPPPDMTAVSPDWCRMLSHSFVGMALCSLMTGEYASFVTLASAGLCYEKRRGIELASALRLIPYLMFTESGSVEGYVASNAVTEKLLLPVMLINGRRDLFHAELGLLVVPEQRRAECERFALAVFQRSIDRQSAPAPINTVRTHVIDGRILERRCAACGAWDRIGKSHSRCSGCMLVYYCCRTCQLAHWKQHKLECGGKRKK